MLSTGGLRCLCRLSLTQDGLCHSGPLLEQSKALVKRPGGAECWWQAEAAPSGLTSRATAALQEAIRDSPSRGNTGYRFGRPIRSLEHARMLLRRGAEGDRKQTTELHAGAQAGYRELGMQEDLARLEALARIATGTS